MPGITGISPLNGLITWHPNVNEADPFTQQGGPSDPRHGQPYVSTYPDIAGGQKYPSNMTQWGDQTTQEGRDGDYIDPDSGAFTSAGFAGPGTDGFDATPNTHAGPWARDLPPGLVGSVQPDAVALQRAQSGVLHSDGLTGSAKPWRNSADPLQDNWQDYWNPDPIPEPSIQTPLTNGQVKQSTGGGWFSTDAINNPDGHNQFQGNAHMHRRWSAGSVPGAYMWMKPGGRPLMGMVPGPARPPVGTGPFEGQDIGSGYQAYPGVLQHPAGAYEAPPDPYQPGALTAQTGLISADLTE